MSAPRDPAADAAGRCWSSGELSGPGARWPSTRSRWCVVPSRLGVLTVHRRGPEVTSTSTTPSRSPRALAAALLADGPDNDVAGTGPWSERAEYTRPPAWWSPSYGWSRRRAGTDPRPRLLPRAERRADGARHGRQRAGRPSQPRPPRGSSPHEASQRVPVLASAERGPSCLDARRPGRARATAHGLTGAPGVGQQPSWSLRRRPRRARRLLAPVEDLDVHQAQTGEGPCVDCLRGGRDPERETGPRPSPPAGPSWVRYVAAGLSNGARGAVALARRGVRGAQPLRRHRGRPRWSGPTRRPRRRSRMPRPC